MSASAPGASPLPVGPGTCLGPYEVIASLGAGGMGEVFRARDLRLGREVALKLLPPEMATDPARVRRFEQEARASSALNHPHILTVYDVGTVDSRLYIVMELVEGQTMRELLGRGPLVLRRSLDLAVQMASGLAKAHAAGIVHRDVKPENVMVTPDGFVKVLDFGLAKLAAAEDESVASAPTASLTQTDAVLGSVGYMSPEQARGHAVDFRADQFSFGAVLYEMLSGRRAFLRPTPVATLGAILHDEPEVLASVAPRVPAELAWIVERCLAKDPDHRYGATRDLVRDLERVRDQAIRTASSPAAARPATRAKRRWAAVLAGGSAILAAALAWQLAERRSPAGVNPGAGPRSLAVLPFRSLAGMPENEYFAAGITEAIGTELAKARGLSVISGSTVTPYRGQAVDPQKAGRGLGVTHLLDGSVQRTGSRVRVTARLTEVSTGRQVWADRYDREDKDVFALQDDIARSVGTALRVSLRGRSGSDPPTSSLAAYDAYLRGRFHYRNFYDVRESKSAAEGLAAVARFQEAVALDPRFAQAYAALGETYASLFFYLGPRKEAEEQAYVAIERALSLDPDLPEAYAARGLLAWTLAHGFPHERAAADFRHALELNPNLVDARWMLGRLYMHVGLLDAALSQLEIARRLAPDELRNVNRIGIVYLFQGRYEDALAAFAKIPPDRLDDETVRPLLYLGRTEEASRVAQAGMRKSPNEPSFHASYALVLAREGDFARAEQEVARAIQADRGSSHYHHAEYDIGSAYALVGRKAAAVEWLERAAAHGMPCYPLFRDDPYLASLKGDRAFESLLARLKTQWEGYRRDLLPPPP